MEPNMQGKADSEEIKFGACKMKIMDLFICFGPVVVPEKMRGMG